LVIYISQYVITFIKQILKLMQSQLIFIKFKKYLLLMNNFFLYLITVMLY